MKQDTHAREIFTLDQINEILSDTLLQVSERRISPNRAKIISQLALALSRNIVNTELKDRIEFLEQRLRKQ